MRIIAGTARGKTLIAPQGMQTRPTADRTREALFNILASDIPGCRLLDVFSGTGAICAEALSRGAEYCAAIDISPFAIEAIRKNTSLKGIDGRCEVLQGDWKIAIKKLKCVFDIVYIDPPYRMTEVYAEVFHELKAQGLISGRSLIVMEYEENALIGSIDGSEICDERKYGKARIRMIRLCGE